jgi:hypothetical protein
MPPTLITLVHTDYRVKFQNLGLILQMHIIKLLQLVANGAYYLGHSDHHLIMNVFHIEQL